MTERKTVRGHRLYRVSISADYIRERTSYHSLLLKLSEEHPSPPQFDPEQGQRTPNYGEYRREQYAPI